MMEQVRPCAVCPMENWLGSSMNQIQGWNTVRESYSHALEQGPLSTRHRRQTEHAAMPRTKRQSVRRAKRIPAAAAVNPPGAFSVAVQNLRDFDCCLLDSRSGSIPTPGESRIDSFW